MVDCLFCFNHYDKCPLSSFVLVDDRVFVDLILYLCIYNIGFESFSFRSFMFLLHFLKICIYLYAFFLNHTLHMALCVGCTDSL